MKKKKKLKWAPWVALVLVAAVLAGLPTLSSRMQQETGTQASVVSAAAELRDMETTLVGGGQLESSEVLSVKIPENVKLTEYLVENGELVQEGDAIAKVDRVSVMTAITEVEDTLKELATQINTADKASASSTISSVPAGRVKALYAAEGDDVETVMLEHGALAVIALDDVMAVKLEQSAQVSAGDKVTVLIGDVQVTGRVKSNVGEELVITVDDENYAIGTGVTVLTQDGVLLGQGELYVYNAWKVLGTSGTVSKVKVKEEQSISAGQTLFSISENGKSADYQALIDKRLKYEELMQELFVMYRSGVITAPGDGIVSGVDSTGAYMLAAVEGSTGGRIVLLAEGGLVEIKTTSLTGGTVGVTYGATLQAADENGNLVSGTWAQAGLPGGLTLDSGSGLISGTPTTAGSFPVEVGFTHANGTCTARYTLVIEASPETPRESYTGYVAQVTVAGGDTIQVLQGTTPYSISDLNQLPSVTVDPTELTQTAVWSGQTVVDGNFAAGDQIWVVVDSNGQLVKTAKIGGSSGEMPGGFGGGGMGGFSGGSFSFGGSFSGVSGYGQEEDDGLYTREKLTVAQVTSQENMTLSITVDELDITKVYVGQKARITLNAIAGEETEAVVTDISNSGENSGGNSKFTVELELSKSGDMLPGMNATAVIPLSLVEDTLCVPAAAVYELAGQSVVYTAQDPKTGALTNPVPVETGIADADYVQILSGLEEGVTVFYEIYETTAAPAVNAPAAPGAMNL